MPELGCSNFICKLWQEITEEGVSVTTSHLLDVFAKLPVNVPPPSPLKFCLPSTENLKGVVWAPLDL